MMSPYIEVSKLDFSYGHREILKQISFQVEQGSFVSIVGPNGSGKSTLLKNISTALKPQKGKVLLKDDDIFGIRPKDLARKMAVVPQDTAIQFPFTVLDTVLMGRMPYQRRFQGESAQDLAIARWAMKLTNTWYLADRPVTDISGGERQRVVVARALTQEPQVVLLDEPTAHLDPQHQLELLELLRSLNQAGRLTVLAVLHDLNLAAQFSDYVLLLHQSRIAAAGVPEEILTPGNIRDVYNIEVIISPNQLTGRPNIIPVGRSIPESKRVKDFHVHLVCGGGTGAQVMDKLVQNGYKVSCGVLNIGDSDWSKARTLGLQLVEEAPFTAVRPETYEKNKYLISQADAVVLLPIPFGTGNLGSLEQARDAGAGGKTIILVGEKDIGNRDFTGGKAGVIYREILAGKTLLVSRPKDIFPLLESLAERKE